LFRDDGKMLASGGEDQTVRLWDVAGSQAVGEPLRGHGKPVTALAFAPGGRTLASGSIDATVGLWDLEGSQFLGEPLEGPGAVWSLAFSPDGKILASGGSDQTVRLWNLSEEAWISRGCARANRNLSVAEWRHYIGANTPYRRTCVDLPAGSGFEADGTTR
jgi:WD40 repeat protein